MNASIEDLTGQLMSIMLKLIELNEEFHEFKSADMATIIQTSLKSSVSHPFLCKVYSAGTLINDLRSARLAAYHKNKLTEPTTVTVATVATVATAATATTVGDPEPVKSTEEAEVSTTTLNPYTQFVKDMRPTVARENPLMTPQEIVKEIARQWKARSVKPDAEEPKKPKKAKETKADVVVTPVPATGISHSPTAATEPSVHEKKPKKAKASVEATTATPIQPLSVPVPPPVPEKKSKKASKASEDPVAPPVAPAAAPTVAPEPEAPKKKVKKTKVEEPPSAPAPAPAPVEPDITEADDVSAPLCERRKKIPKHIKTLVWNTHMGISNLESKCFSCRTEKVDARNFQCGHVVAEAKGGDLKISNLRPICQPCNGSMGTRSMNEFTKEFFGWEV